MPPIECANLRCFGEIASAARSIDAVGKCVRRSNAVSDRPVAAQQYNNTIKAVEAGENDSLNGLTRRFISPIVYQQRDFFGFTRCVRYVRRSRLTGPGPPQFDSCAYAE